jgi:hypothetical protein
VLDLPGALEPLADYYRAIAGEHPDWGRVPGGNGRAGQTLLRITPTRWDPIATGGFPARLVD